MSKAKQKTQEFPNNLSVLDDLIQRCYRELSENEKINAKLGDLLKMIELRRKLAPGDSDQKEFWSMLEQIRQEALQKDDVKRSRQRKKAPKKQRTPVKGSAPARQGRASPDGQGAR